MTPDAEPHMDGTASRPGRWINSQLFIMGGFRLQTASGALLPLSGRKGPALLSYLALSPGRTATRDKLASLLWGDKDEAHARNSLRQLLSRLRVETGAAEMNLFTASPHAVTFSPEIEVDVLTFHELAASASTEDMTRASDLYRGPLLDGFFSGAPAFDDWAAVQRGLLAEKAIGLNDALARSLPDTDALSFANRLLTLDPLRESSHYLKMKLHMARGEPTLALRQYALCKEVLWQELEVTPSEDVEALHREICRHQDAEPSKGADAEPAFRRGWVDPAKQSVLVLPFLNMSGDPSQEFLADGITEDIIIELGRCPHLFVVSRNSSFYFKERSSLAQEIAGEIGVTYMVEGSIRVFGKRIRINSQLVEAATGRQVWGERFDVALDDVFTVQDEVVRMIAASIPGVVDRNLLEAIRRERPENLTAYECELRGRWAFHHWSEGVSEATAWFERAVEADPHYVSALAWLARCLWYNALVNCSPGEGDRARARALIDRAVSHGSRNPAVNSNAASIYLASGEWQLAEKHALIACGLNPNDPVSLNIMALVLTYTGRAAESLSWHERSERIEPYALDDQRLDVLCDTYYLLGQFEKVIEIHRNYLHAPAGVKDVLAAALAQAGQVERAHQIVAEMEEKGFSREESARSIEVQLLHCSREEERQKWLEGYRKAGIPV